MIPVLIPSLPDTDAIVPYLRRIDQTHTYSNYGPLSREFTAKLCAFVSERTSGALVAATITGNGTSAIELALRYRIAGRTGRLCLMPAYTFVATAHAAVNVGLEPLFIDADPETLSLTPAIAEQVLAMTEGDLAVVVVVSPFGSPPGRRLMRRMGSRWRSTPPPPRSTCAGSACSRSASACTPLMRSGLGRAGRSSPPIRN